MAQQEEERMTKRRTGIWSVLAIASLLVGACTQAPAGQTTTTTGGTTAGQADTPGTLTLNMGSEPDTIDPQKSSFVNEIGQASFVFEGLMSFDTKTSKPVPAAAAAAPKLSADGLKYTYTLKDGLKYSDGAALTAKNFEYAFLRGCDPTAAGDYAFVFYIIVGCEAYNTMDTKKATPAELSAARAKVGVKATSDKDIEFTLTDPAPYFVPITALWQGWPVRESDVTKGGDKWTEPATYIGNGPFKLTEWKHNEKMVYERNDNYTNAKGEKAKLKKWTKVMINEAAVAFAAYRNNELDAVGIGAEQLRTVEGDADLKAQTINVGGSCTIYVG